MQRAKGQNGAQYIGRVGAHHARACSSQGSLAVLAIKQAPAYALATIAHNSLAIVNSNTQDHAPASTPTSRQVDLSLPPPSTAWNLKTGVGAYKLLALKKPVGDELSCADGASLVGHCEQYVLNNQGVG